MNNCKHEMIEGENGFNYCKLCGDEEDECIVSTNSARRCTPHERDKNRRL